MKRFTLILLWVLCVCSGAEATKFVFAQADTDSVRAGKKLLFRYAGGDTFHTDSLTVNGPVTITGALSGQAGTFTTLKADSTWFGAGDFILAPTQNEFRLGTGFKMSIGDATPNGGSGSIHIVGPGGAATSAAYTANSLFVLEDTSAVMQVAVNSDKKFRMHVGNSDSDENIFMADLALDKWAFSGGAGGNNWNMAVTATVADGDSIDVDTYLTWGKGSGGGLITIVAGNGSLIGEFYCRSGAVTETLDPLSRCSDAKGTATSVNLYYSSVADKYYIENLRGVANTFAIFYKGR